MMEYALLFLAAHCGVTEDELREGAERMRAKYEGTHEPELAPADAANEARQTFTDLAPIVENLDDVLPEHLDLRNEERKLVVLPGPATAYEDEYHAYVDGGGRIETSGHAFRLVARACRCGDAATWRFDAKTMTGNAPDGEPFCAKHGPNTPPPGADWAPKAPAFEPPRDYGALGQSLPPDEERREPTAPPQTA
jgi:hypothetical protein